MYSHKNIWQAIDRLADNLGYSPSGLAKQAGLDPTSFNKSKRVSPDGKPRWPSTESISKILAGTGATMSEFMSLIDPNDKTKASLNTSKIKPEDIAHAAAKILLNTKSVLFNTKEPFKYTSGNIGPVYVDCRRIMSFPEERGTLMDMATQLLKKDIGTKNIDYIAGGETAGIPYAAFIAERMGKPMLYVRKKPKGVGRMNQIEGHFEDGASPNVLLVEDLQNFGHSKQIFVDALHEAGAVVDHFFTLFDYGIRPDVPKVNKNMGLRAHHLCNWHDILDVARKESYLDKETLSSVEAYLKDPESWKP